MGVMNLQRNELEIGDVELDVSDYEAENQESTNSFEPDVQV